MCSKIIHTIATCIVACMGLGIVACASRQPTEADLATARWRANELVSAKAEVTFWNGLVQSQAGSLAVTDATPLMTEPIPDAGMPLNALLEQHGITAMGLSDDANANVYVGVMRDGEMVYVESWRELQPKMQTLELYRVLAGDHIVRFFVGAEEGYLKAKGAATYEAATSIGAE